MLKINDLKVSLEEGGSDILKGISLEVKPGEVHAIMGVNGSGKSTLASVLSGREGYAIDSGSVEFLGKDLLDMEPEERAQAGLFMAFQYPLELPGVVGTYFLRTACNSVRKARGESAYGVREFQQIIKDKAELLQLDEKMLQRAVNEGFSGGEKKRNEVLQMLLLDPKLAILDETDSGLDIDALQTVAKGVNLFREDKSKSVILITHYQRLLDFIVPDYVHVLIDGKIVKSGGKELAHELESRGYNWVREEAGLN